MRTLCVILALLPFCLVVFAEAEAISLFPKEALSEEERYLVESIVSVELPEHEADQEYSVELKEVIEKLPEHEADQEFDSVLTEDSEKLPEHEVDQEFDEQEIIEAVEQIPGLGELSSEEEAEIRAELRQIAEMEQTDQWEKNPSWNVPPEGMTRSDALKVVSAMRSRIINGALPSDYNMLPHWDHAAYCATDRQRWELGGRTDVDMDLHGQGRIDAVALTKRLLVWGRRLAFRAFTSCDTGKGNHSPGNIPVLQPAVEEMLTSCKYEFTKRWDHIGMTGKFDINSFSPNANTGPACTNGRN